MRRPKPSLVAVIVLTGACSGGQASGDLERGDAAPGLTDSPADDDALGGEPEPSAPDGPSGPSPAQPTSSVEPSGGGGESSGGGGESSGDPEPIGTVVPAPPPSDDTLIDEPPVEGPGDCEREIEFQAVELSDPAPFDVIIVADHSDSLSWSRDDLSSGLSELLSRVSGADARFFVLTPTQYGPSSSEAVDLITGNELVNWSNPVTGEPYEHAVTEYSSVCTSDQGSAMECPEYPVVSVGPFTLEGRWTFQMPEPIAEIGHAMTAAELAEQQAAISDAILNLAGSGSLQEQPLCTLNRYISQAPTALPENALFVILSDEDDVTTPDDCLASYRYERTENPNYTIQIGCTSDCDGYRYRALSPRPGYEIVYTCTPVDDQGMQFPDQAVSGTIASNSADDCTEVTSFPCRETDLSRVEEECGSDVLIDCELVCTPDASNTTCFLSFDQDIDCSTPFEYEGVMYSDFLDYCTQQYQTTEWTQCEQVDGYWVIGDSTSYGGSESIESLIPGSRTEDLVDHFQTLADGVFADGNYFVEVIGFDPTFSCELGDGQSYATTLGTLASTPEDIFPICESYAPALARIERFAGTLLDTVYSFALTEYEEVESVRVTDNTGQERELLEDDFSYDELSQTLVLRPEALSPRDVSLTIEVARNCVPKAR